MALILQEAHVHNGAHPVRTVACPASLQLGRTSPKPIRPSTRNTPCLALLCLALLCRALPGLALPRRCSLAERLRVRRSKKMFWVSWCLEEQSSSGVKSLRDHVCGPSTISARIQTWTSSGAFRGCTFKSKRHFSAWLRKSSARSPRQSNDPCGFVKCIEAASVLQRKSRWGGLQ